MAQGLIKHTLSDWMLKWTLPSGVTSFPTQQVEVDLTDCDQVQIMFALSTASTRKRLIVSYITGRSYYAVLLGPNFVQSGTTTWYARSYSAFYTHISFSGGYYRTFSSSGTVVANDARMIPMYIKGRKVI